MALETFLLDLIIILVVAKAFGQLMQRLGQPFVLGELLGGALVGMHGLGWLPEHEFIHLLAQVGLILLLFEIGLETNLDTLIKLGPKSIMVAIVGIVLPLAGGYLFCTSMGLAPMSALLVGCAFTATSIGISVRALAELGENKSTEGQIVLGAALFDDVVGLLILSVITALVEQSRNPGAGGEHSILFVSILTLLFPVLAVLIGSWLVKPLIRMVDKMTVRGAMVVVSVVMALVFAFIAEKIGTSPIIGAFTAGLILARTHRADVIETQLKPIADIVTPIFFVSIGASLNIQLLNPFNPANQEILLIALGASVVAFGTKFLSGFACIGEGIRRSVIGVSMAPRGEVVLIFANLGLAQGLINQEWFAVLIIMIFITAMATPALLKLILSKNTVHPIGSYSEIPLAGYESEERM
ncbi:MAG: cation:proton antiporter [Vampirovibrio sp.]|nr:cation:proton antiporter [Vampirovibrio sp.]